VISLRVAVAIPLRVASILAFACPTFGQAREIDIPAQDLRVALDQFILITNVQLVYRVDDLTGLRSRPVHGQTDVKEALGLLLDGTGIDFRRDPSGAIVVSKKTAREVGVVPPSLIKVGASAYDDVETVTVTGFRASLGRVLEIKRHSVGVRDSIIAEDIGKYPARNVAESLTRVPGVVISRDTRTDEGRSVTVRGLPANYTIVTINGNPVHMETGDDVGSNARSVDLDAFGADLFSRVDFYKSPTAKLDEGGIGGVIDMRTPHPFDYDGRKIGYSLGYGINTFRDKGVPIGTFQASDTWGPLGVLLAVTASRASYELMGSEAAGWGQACNELSTNISNNTNSIYYDFGAGHTATCGTTANPGIDPRSNIGSYTMDQINQAFVPRWVRSHLELDDRTRYSGLLSLQYKPSEKLDVSFDLLTSLLTDHRNDFTMGGFFRSTQTTAAGYAAAAGDLTRLGKSNDNGLVPLSVGIDANNNLYGTFANYTWQSGNVWYMGKDKFLSGTFNTKYQPLDNLTITAVANLSDYHGFYSQNSLAAYVYNTTTTYDPRGNYNFSQATTNVDLTNPALYQGSTVGSAAGFDVDANYWKEGDRVVTGKLAAQYGFETGIAPIGHVDVEMGVSWVSTQKTNDKKSNGGLVKNTVLSNGLTLATMLPANYMVNHLKVTNFLDGVKHADRPTNWASVPDSTYNMVGFIGILSKDVSQLSSVFNVTEAVQSAYADANSAGTILDKMFKVDVGLRLARTRMWGFNYSSSKDASGKTVYIKNPIHNSYNDLLPTISMSFDVLDNVVLRASYGKTITRAGLGNIAQAMNVPSWFNNAASTGNPDLKPLIANNIDFGAEWYFDRDAVLSVGLFYKGLKNLISSRTSYQSWSTLDLPDSALTDLWHEGGLISNPVDPSLLITVTQPVNLNPMVVKGFEVFYQQPFSFLSEPFDGLGAMASFTYTAGAQNGPGTGFVANDGTIYKMQIQGLSTYSYSATGYYEKDGISLRLSYSWRSKTPASDSNYYSTNLRQWNQARGSLDATVGYEFTDYLELRLDVSNLLNESEIQYLADATGKDSKIGSRFSGAGYGTTRVNTSYIHGVNYMISVRGRL
jgi:iron complex outermembrane receptor protein